VESREGQADRREVFDKRYVGKLSARKIYLKFFNCPETVAPLIGIVSRFADQKGFDLIAKGAGPASRSLAIVALEQEAEIRKGASRPGQEVP